MLRVKSWEKEESAPIILLSRGGDHNHGCSDAECSMRVRWTASQGGLAGCPQILRMLKLMLKEANCRKPVQVSISMV